MADMTGKGGGWCRTTVAIREDILTAARSAGLDIQDLCNRALADAAGIRFRQEMEIHGEPVGQVIVAGTEPLPSGAEGTKAAAGESVHPVINADDPKARNVVKELPRPKPVQKPAALPGRVSHPEQALEGVQPATAPPTTAPRIEKHGKTGGGKSSKRPVRAPIRQFVAERIVREDGEDCHVSKDALYAALAHWCREHRIAAPDRRTVTIMLKNQFAMTEIVVNGEPSWTNARLR